MAGPQGESKVQPEDPSFVNYTTSVSCDVLPTILSVFEESGTELHRTSSSSLNAKSTVTNSNRNVCPVSAFEPESAVTMCQSSSGGNYMQTASSSNVNSPVDSSICPNYMVNVFDVRTVSSLTNTNTKLDSASGYFCAYRPYNCDKTNAANYLPRDVMLDNVPVVCDIYQSTPSSFECFQSNIGNVWYFHRLCLTIITGSVS